MTMAKRTKYDRSQQPLGTVTIRHGRGNRGNKKQRFIKVALSGPKQQRWMLYARWLWEQDHGPVPEGYRVAHADGDLLNDDPANLVLCTPGDVAYLAHKNDPKMSRENFRKLRKATADHNRERGRVNRALNWLPSMYYAWFPAAGQALNEPRRNAHRVLSLCGVKAPPMKWTGAAIGYPDCSRGAALVLCVMSDPPQLAHTKIWRRQELLERINAICGRFEWRPRTMTGLDQALGALARAGLIERPRNGRYLLSEFAACERTRRSPVFPVRGEILAAAGDVEKVDRLSGICRLCGCTEENACCDWRGPCAWAAPDLCSHCEEGDDESL